MSSNRIDPVELARRFHNEPAFLQCFIETLKDREDRVRELFWFLQFLSIQPGGLELLLGPLVKSLEPQYKEKSAGRAARGYWNVRNPEGLPKAICDACHLEFVSMRCRNVCDLDDLLRTFPSIGPALFALMDQHKEKTLATIADTEIKRRIFRELEFSARKNVPVPIIGDSRIGKTSAGTVFCNARPGRSRLVEVPPSNRERDFMAAHADALGIEYNARTGTHLLRSHVQYVNQHGNLFLVYEEAQFLTPSNYTQSTPPNRLNWVRRQVVDRGRGAAFLATPQTYQQTLEQYMKVTGYRMEQWLGRLAPPVLLPDNLGREDMLAVARLHFPSIPAPLLKIIVARAMRSEGYLKNLEITAKRASFIAEEAGRDQVSIEDVNTAVAEMMPETVAAAVPAPALRRSREADAVPPQGRSGRSADEDISGRDGPSRRLPKGARELVQTAA